MVYYVEKGNFNHLLIRGMTFHCYHNLLTKMTIFTMPIMCRTWKEVAGTLLNIAVFLKKMYHQCNHMPFWHDKDDENGLSLSLKWGYNLNSCTSQESKLPVFCEKSDIPSPSTTLKFTKCHFLSTKCAGIMPCSVLQNCYKLLFFLKKCVSSINPYPFIWIECWKSSFTLSKMFPCLRNLHFSVIKAPWLYICMFHSINNSQELCS